MVGVLGDEKEKGIIPRAFECIFMMLKSDTSQKYLVWASFLEIYKEDIIDLLAKSSL